MTNTELLRDIAELAKKHQVAIITAAQGGIENATKNLEGMHLFIVTGKKKNIHTSTGQSVQYPSSMTLKLSKNRFKPLIDNYSIY